MTNMKFYTVAEAAKILRRNEVVIRRYAKSGRLAGSMSGRRWLFSETDLLAFYENGRRKMVPVDDNNHVEAA